ncbi:SusC/RagA family TonB-linked outer membrane protein [bacterium]|nr:SusC/RagA family TonB-linked outer membrane protein [bacterium]
MKCKLFLTSLCFTMIMVPLYAFAQGTATISGKVTDEAGDALPGANVLIQRTNLGAATDIEGTYKFTIPVDVIRGQQVVIEARFIGYRTKTESILLSPGNISQDFALAIDALDMDAIIVTGVVEETPRAKMAFTVGHIGQDALEQVPASDPASALYGKVAGVRVIRGSGQPGSSPAMQLRAPTSINAFGRSQDPLYIVDGVIIDPSISGSPLTDIPAEDIASIEVVKGAAGASLYGSRASNGVVRIITNRGQNLGLNQTRIRIRNEFGFNQISKKLDLNTHHAFKVAETAYTDANGLEVTPGDFIDADNNFVDPRARGARLPDTYSDAEHAAGIEFFDNEFKYVGTGNVGDPLIALNEPFDQVDRFFNEGPYLSNSISISRNMENTNFLVSFQNFRQEGIIDGSTGLDRRSVRVNVDHRFRNTLSLSVSGLYSTTKRDLIEADDNGRSDPIFNLTFMAPDADLALTDENGDLFILPDPESIEDNPLNFVLNNDRKGTRRRVMGSFTGRWEPVRWFNLEGNFSFDRSDRNDDRFWPIGFLQSEPGPEALGRLELRNTFDEALNGSITASFQRRFGELTVRSKTRGLFERAEFQFNEADGRDLAVQGTRSISTADPNISLLSSEIQPVRSEGYSFITGVDYKDRYIADVLIRRDGSSLFGPDERWHTYYRGSAAYRLSQEPWWFIPAIEEFKIRGSFGTAGGRPNFFARFETWEVTGGNVTKSTLGNKELKPEFAKELEFGFDAFFLNRFNLEFTYANSDVEDQLLFVPLPSFTGFVAQWQNAGDLSTNTFEVSLNAALLQQRDVSWTAGLTFDRTRTEITKLNIAPYRVNELFISEGEELGALFGARMIRDAIGLLPQGLPANQFDVNDDGFVVWVGEGNSFSDGISNELWGLETDLTDEFGEVHTFNWGMPIKLLTPELDANGEFSRYNDFHRIGSTEPDFNLGFTSNFRYRGLSVYTVLDAQIGGDVYNNTRQWGLRELKLGEVDQSGKPDELKKPGAYYATLYNVNAETSHFVEDATFMKLRELRVSYTFDRSKLSGILGRLLNKVSIGISGRNLLTFTGYKGFDPEVGAVRTTNDAENRGVASAVISRLDLQGYPNFRTITGVFEIEF